MFWILMNFFLFGLNIIVCNGDVFTFNGGVGLLNIFLAGFFLGAE